jgi:hypothetical protein
MTKRELMGSLITVALAGGLVAPVWTEEAITVDEKTIRSLEERQVTAILTGDVTTLERLWSERFVVNNPQNGISANRDVVIDRVKQGLIRYSSYDLRIEAIRFHQDVAIVMGSETVVPKDDPVRGTQPIHRRYTDIWLRSGSTWHAIARHANVIAER